MIIYLLLFSQFLNCLWGILDLDRVWQRRATSQLYTVIIFHVVWQDCLRIPSQKAGDQGGRDAPGTGTAGTWHGSSLLLREAKHPRWSSLKLKGQSVSIDPECPRRWRRGCWGQEWLPQMANTWTGPPVTHTAARWFKTTRHPESQGQRPDPRTSAPVPWCSPPEVQGGHIPSSLPLSHYPSGSHRSVGSLIITHVPAQRGWVQEGMACFECFLSVFHQ